MFSQIEPETVSIRSGSMVSSPDVVRIGDPETCWGLISIEKRGRGHGVDNKVVFDDIVSFNTIFDEDSMSHNPVSNILLNFEEMDTMNSDGSVVTVMNSITEYIRFSDIADQMEVDSI